MSHFPLDPSPRMQLKSLPPRRRLRLCHRNKEGGSLASLLPQHPNEKTPLLVVKALPAHGTHGCPGATKPQRLGVRSGDRHGAPWDVQ